jgi:hypothetical protein
MTADLPSIRAAVSTQAAGVLAVTDKAELAIQKLRRLQALPNGTRVIANGWVEGVIDGMTTDGKYIVKFDRPVCFPSIGKSIYRTCFDTGSVKELRNEQK